MQVSGGTHSLLNIVKKQKASLFCRPVLCYALAHIGRLRPTESTSGFGNPFSVDIFYLVQSLFNRYFLFSSKFIQRTRDNQLLSKVHHHT